MILVIMTVSLAFYRDPAITARNKLETDLAPGLTPQEPMVSCIVAVHNEEVLIRQCIESMVTGAGTLSSGRAAPGTVSSGRAAPGTLSSDRAAPGTLSSGRAAPGTKRAVASLSSNSGAPAYLQNDSIRLDLRRRPARLGLKVAGPGRLSELRQELSNDHWARWVTADALTAYAPGQAGGWHQFFLGPSAKWGADGGRHASAPGFDWPRIDGIRIELLRSKQGARPVTVSTTGLALVRAQREGKLVFVFDDGYQSILPAASYLHEHGMPGNVAVTGKYVDYPTEDYLNVFQLRTLQDKLGWDMVNHGQAAGAVRPRRDRQDLAGFSQDVLRQAAWLEANGLNSAPNWFIYPNGETTTQTEQIVRRYYMFARVTADGPEAYPYGDQHAVTDLLIRYTTDRAGHSVALTRPAEVLAAVRQAVKYHLT